MLFVRLHFYSVEIDLPYRCYLSAGPRARSGSHISNPPLTFPVMGNTMIALCIVDDDIIEHAT